MSNVTELGDSTLPDGFFDDGSITLSEISSIVSTTTPLITKSTSHFQLSTRSPTSTPNRSQFEATNGTPTSGDDYLRRDVRYMKTQLTNLKNILHSENKHYSACVDKYENLVENLREEIVKMKKSLDSETDKTRQFLELSVKNKTTIAELKNSLQIAENRISKYNEVIAIHRHSAKSFVEKYLKSDVNALADSGVDFDAQFETDDPLQWIETFGNCLEAVDKIVDDKARSNDEFMSRLKFVDDSLSNCRLELGIKNEEIERLEEKTLQLSGDVDDLSKQLSKTRKNLRAVKNENDDLHSELKSWKGKYSNGRTELKDKNEEIDRLTDQIQHLSRLQSENEDLRRNLELSSSSNVNDRQELTVKNDKIELLNSQVELLTDQFQNCTRQLEESRQNLSRIEHENFVLLKELDLTTLNYDSIKGNLSAMDDLSKAKFNLESKLTELSVELTERTERMKTCQNVLDTMTREYNKSKLEFSDEKSTLESNLSTLSQNLAEFEGKIEELSKENVQLKEEIDELKRAREESEGERVKCLSDLKLETSILILDNSKLKEELNNMKFALETAGLSAERTTNKFEELKDLYSSLNVMMESKEIDLRDLENRRSALESALSAKDALLTRLVDNFNELSSIFADPSVTTDDWSLKLSSSSSEATTSFLNLKHRLLGLSRDYIALTRRNDECRKEFDNLSDSLKRKDEEIRNVGKRWEKKCVQLKIALDNLEGENRSVASQNIEKDVVITQLKRRIESLDILANKGCQDCGPLKKLVQQLKIDMVDRDSTIATLELHIQSCCEYNRKKALQYKHEMHQYKRQLESHRSYAYNFGLSPVRNFVPKVDVGLQIGDSYIHQLSGGFVEKFKIGELIDKVGKLEKERTVLKRLCKVRTDRIQELENKNESPPSSSSPRPTRTSK